MHILLIEDDNDAASYVIKGLKESGHIVDRASDGEEGLYMALDSNFDVLVVDRMLPKLDGLNLIEKVRKRNRKKIKYYIEIYLKADQKKIISKNYKKLYKKTKDLVGIKIKPEYPKKPDIIIYNDFNKTIKKLSNELFIKLNIKFKY